MTQPLGHRFVKVVGSEEKSDYLGTVHTASKYQLIMPRSYLLAMTKFILLGLFAGTAVNHQGVYKAVEKSSTTNCSLQTAGHYLLLSHLCILN